MSSKRSRRPPSLSRKAWTPRDRAIARATVGAAKKSTLASGSMSSPGPDERVPESDRTVGLSGIGATTPLKEAPLFASCGCIASLPWWTARFHLGSSARSPPRGSTLEICRYLELTPLSRRHVGRHTFLGGSSNPPSLDDELDLLDGSIRRCLFRDYGRDALRGAAVARFAEHIPEG